MAKLTDIRGITDATADKLKAAGATTEDKLLELGASWRARPAWTPRISWSG